MLFDKNLHNVLSQIDHCNRLWVLDNGKIGQEVVCSAQLLVFDLATDKLIKRVKIPNKLTRNSKTKVGRLVTPIVETHGPRCTRTTVSVLNNHARQLLYFTVLKHPLQSRRRDVKIYICSSNNENIIVIQKFLFDF